VAKKPVNWLIKYTLKFLRNLFLAEFEKLFNMRSSIFNSKRHDAVVQIACLATIRRCVYRNTEPQRTPFGEYIVA
jgi:vesicle coat complex subunit